MKRPDFFLCYFETTRRCDQACPNCMTRRGAAAAAELTTREAQRLVLDELAEICPRGAVSFSGGEILQRPDHLELIAHNAANGLYSFVNTSGPSFVTATVCSKCADRLPSLVTAVQPSDSTLTAARPMFTIGSIASTMPSASRGPRPGSP